jgi:hypothetical protein
VLQLLLDGPLHGELVLHLPPDVLDLLALNAQHYDAEQPVQLVSSEIAIVVDWRTHDLG